ncbi:MAG: hypothetical protein IJ668_12965 [Selenomonadaceae bacterium]|nr:hypothetical protein [Selenomonadaceae bacterium]
MWRVLLVCLMMCFMVVAPLNAEDQSVEPADNSWWENNVIVATGYGVPPEGIANTAKARRLAHKAAMSDAYRLLAEQAGAVRITANETVTVKEVSAVIKGAKIISEEYDEYDICTVVMSVPVYGVKDSLAQAVLRRVDKEDFPTVEPDQTVEGNYTGLVIDCGDLELNPVMLPAILNDSDQSIYAYNNLDYEKVIANGMIGYVELGADDEPITVEPKVEEPTAVEPTTEQPTVEEPTIGARTKVLSADARGDMSRAGDNPLVVKVVGLNADNSCPIVSSADANKILSENRASQFLNNGSVVFMSNRIRGVRY